MSRKKSHMHLIASNQCLGNDEYLDNFTRYYYQYRNIAQNIYRWKNLPPNLESRHIEKALYSHGQCAFFDDENLGLIALPSSNNNNYNVLGDPTSITVFGFGFSKQISLDKAVRVINNDSLVATDYFIRYFCDKLATIEKTIEKNLNQQRNPYLVRTDKDSEFSVKAALKKVENDEPAIFVDKQLAMGNDSGFLKEDIWKDFRSLDYNLLKKEYQKELYEYLGLNSSNNQEGGQNYDQTNVNNSLIEMHLDTMYKCRKQAAEEINAMFGTNIEVEKVIQTLEPSFDTTIQEREGGEDIDG